MVLASYAANLLLISYIHLSTWDPELSTKLRAMEKMITVDSCICHACEKDIERKINSGDYVPGWTLQNKENITLDGYGKLVPL